MIDFSYIKFDCKHFKTGLPCIKNKTLNAICNDCNYYEPIKTKILIIKLGALGDVIRTTPLIEKFRVKFPNAHITWITLSPQILPQKSIDKIYEWNFNSLYIIENSEYDIAINLDKDLEACILLSKIKAESKFGYTFKDNHISPATPEAEHKLITGQFDIISKNNTKSYLKEIFEICQFEFNNEEYLINLNEDLSTKWNQKFNNLSKGKKIIGLNTGCGPRWNTRLWPEESWKELASELNNLGYYPVFLGGELEHEKNKRMSEESETYYPGHFSLEEFIAITNNCEYIVTQVSMMMHIATALKKKLILCNTIFNKHEFEMYNRGVIVDPPYPCECYFGNSCSKGIPCMTYITPQTIVKAVTSLS